MKRERKLPFDPKAFLSKVNGGEPFPIIGRIKMSTPRANPRILFSTFKAARSRRPSSPSRARKPWSHFWVPAISLGKGA